MSLTDIDQLTAASYNPRKIGKNAASGLSASMERFGDVAGIVWNERTGNLVCGHQRVDQLRKMGAQLFSSDGKPELRVGKDGKRFAVRVVDWTEAQEKAANIAANNPRIGGEFTDELQGLLHEVQASLGDDAFEGLQLDALLEQVKQDAEEDEVPEAPTEPITKPGDLWLLGDHRLYCGDSTDETSANLAQGDLSPFIMVTDPPYGVEYGPGWRNEADGGERKRVGRVQNDERVDWTDAYRNFRGDVAYVWCASWFVGEVARNIDDCGMQRRAMLVWAKQRFAMSRGDYHWQHEPCWYAVRRGKKSRWGGDRSQSTVWQIENHAGGHGDKDDAQTTHGTQKPVECMARPMRNHGAKGDVVYDPFLGSGTSIIAAEQTERVCCGLELDPAYCDIIIERWQQYTGGKAKRGTG